jgi:putative membrane protein
MDQRRLIGRGPVTANTGSRARDHLANERTFLSWTRTALAFIGLGVLVAELVDVEGVAAEVLGLSLILLGAIGAVASTSRFLRVTQQLEAGQYQASTIGPVTVGVVTVLVAAVGIAFAIS